MGTKGQTLKRKPTKTRRIKVEKELSWLKYNWSTIVKLAEDRQGWRDFVAPLCLALGKVDRK